MDNLFFNLNPIPSLIYDEDTLCILEVNKAFLEKYRYRPEEISSLTIEDLRPKEDLNLLYRILDDSDPRKIRESDSFRHQAKDGTIFYVSVHSQPIQWDGKDARLVVLNDLTEQVKTANAAQKAYEELNLLVNHSPLGMIKWSPEFKIIESSERMEQILGYGAEEVRGRGPFFFDFHGEKDAEMVRQNMESLRDGEKNQVHFEVGIHTKDGTPKWIAVDASVLRNEGGKLRAIMTLISDITESVRTKLWYQRLFENANDGIFIMQGNRFVDCNRRITELFGCSRREIIGSTPADFSPERQPDGTLSTTRARKKIKLALEGESQVFEWVHKRKDGMLIDTEVSLNRLELSEGTYLQAIVRDMTEYKKNKRELQRRERLFQNLFFDSPVGMVMVDHKKQVETANSSFKELFGYTDTELLCRPIDEVVVPAKSTGDRESGERLMKRIDSSGTGESIEIKAARKDGTAVQVELNCNRVEGLQSPKFLYIIQDISERKAAENKLKELLKEKEILLAEIHHRVKNNLAIISGLLQLEAMNWEDNPLIQSVMEKSQLRIYSMASIHEKLYQSNAFSDLNLENYITELVDAIYDRMELPGREIEINVKSDDIQLNINQAVPTALIINELVTNAFKYAFKNEKGGRLDVELTSEGGAITLAVEDNGHGLPDNFKEMSEKSLEQLLINQLTEQLEGELKIESGKGEGTRFEVKFSKSDKAGSSSGKLRI